MLLIGDLAQFHLAVAQIPASHTASLGDKNTSLASLSSDQMRFDFFGQMQLVVELAAGLKEGVYEDDISSACL